jgi:competence protein ComEC
VRARAVRPCALDLTIGVARGRPGLARALVIADARAVDVAVRDRYADAGLVHALSVSGLHVAIVAGALELLLRAARLPASRAGAAAALGVATYVAVIGAPAPAVRAGRQAGARVRAFGRAPAPLRREPRLRRLARDLAAGTRRGWRAHVAGEVVVGTFAAAATAPLVAWHFGRVSLAGVVANVAAGPILGALQPALFVALLLAPFEPAAGLAADAVRPMLRALDVVAAAAAALPGGVVRTAPTLAGAGCAAAAIVALLAGAAARRRRGRWIVIGAGAMAAAVVLPPSRGGGRSAELHVLDVGQGDAVALRTPRGRWVLFDAGRPGRGADAGARAVIPYLRRRGGDLVALVLSHPHADHVGGAPEVIRRLRPTHVWDAGYALGSDTYRDVLAAAGAAGARWRRVRPGDSLAVDGVVLRVLAPDPAWTAALDDPNSASVVVSARYGRVRFLLVGDAEAPEEHWLAARAAADTAVASALRADVLKVAHHGSRTSTTDAFLARVRPRLAVVSVGAGNSYGHPNADVLDRLRRAGAEVLRTDAEGAIVARTDGARLDVWTRDRQWSAPMPQDGASSAPR